MTEELNNQTEELNEKDQAENVEPTESEEVTETVEQSTDEKSTEETNGDEVEQMTEDMIDEVKVGDRVKGSVVKIEEKAVIVHIEGGKFDGIIPISQLSGLRIENAEEVVAVGDEIEAFVTKVENDEEDGKYILSKRKVDELSSFEDLQKKKDNDEIITAEVKEVVKGGLVVDVGLRGFIPASLISNEYIEDFSDFEGQTIEMKVEELDAEQNRVILSRKAIMESKALEEKQAVLDKLEEGQVVTGTIARLTNFGAFIDLGGVDGLVHVSQIAHHHVEKPEDELTIGNEVDVKIISVDKDAERISLSIKDALPGPFETIEENFSIGDAVKGEVKRLAPFGAFVEIGPGLQGLVHISQISHDHIGTPEEVLEPGQEVQVKILDIDKEAERISLSIKALQEQTGSTNDYDKSYIKQNNYSQQDVDQDAPTLGDMFGDKLKGFKADQ